MGNGPGNPISKSVYGLNVYLRGIGWLLKNKFYLFILFIPTFFGIAALFAGWGFFFGHFDSIIQEIVFDRPESWYMLPLYWLAYGAAFIGILGATLVSCLLLVNILASPIYDFVSCAIEKDLTGKVGSITLWESLCLMGEELKKVLFIALISLGSFLLTATLPILSPIAFVITAFLLGWDFYDYPLARRGLSFSERLKGVFGDGVSVAAFGVWMLIPFVQFVLMPLAVAGGTILCLESDKNR